MKKTIGLLLCGSGFLILSSCQKPSPSSSKEDLTSSTSGIVATSSTGSATSSAPESSGSTSASSEPDYGGDIIYKGLVKIYYHNDSGSYSDKRLWVWGNGVNGAEYLFDNQSSPDEYGVYKVFDMDAAPFNDFDQTAMRFILKNAGTWSGQSPDIVTGFNKYYNYKSSEDGRDLLTIYCVDEGTVVETYNQRDDALGDRLAKVDFTDWKSISCSGTGTKGSRLASEVGVCASYSLYAYTRDYYLLSSEEQASKKADYLLKSGAPNASVWTIELDMTAICGTIYTVEATFKSNLSKTKNKNASWLKLYDDGYFVRTYTYSGNDLGYSLLDSGANLFKLWAPTAASVLLNIYQDGTPNSLRGSHDLTDRDVHTSLTMSPGEKGVWSYTDSENYSGKFYTYTVYTPEGSAETIDPYARSSGVNGVRGAILSAADFDKTDPTGFADSLTALETNDPLPRPNDFSIYEVHVRDFTADKSWISNKGNKNGTYGAFIEEGTSYGDGTTTIKTGFDSLKELKPKAIQLLPVFDADNDERTYTTTTNGVTTVHTPDYNWGYNPLNYNVVDGVYSSNPKSATTKVKEFKNLVQACANNDMRVIMDVVYNHMASTSNNAFNKIVPKYYFLTNSEGYYYDETGCNNTVATGRKMVSNFMVDSVSWWAKEYGIKGFRFDLMGAIESSTMRLIKNALYQIDPEIIVYGEGWRVGGDSTSQSTTNVVYSSLGDKGQGSVGCFNAGARDGLKGETQDGHPAYGFMNKGPSDLTDDILYNAACGYLGEDRYTTLNGIATPPEQTLNYVSCHDNYTLYDTLNYTRNSGMGASGDNSEAMAASLACSSYVLLSQGISFFQGGEEIFRQKLASSTDAVYSLLTSDDATTLPDGVKMVRNSYKFGDSINAYKWDRKATYLSYFNKFAEAFHVRETLVKEGYLGVTSAAIQGTYDKNGTATKISRLWDDLVDVRSDHSRRAILAAQTEFSQLSGSSLHDFYSFLGGRMSGASDTIGIGDGTLAVAFDSSQLDVDTYANLSVSGTAMPIGKYQCLITMRLA
jgi:type I pullulanase